MGPPLAGSAGGWDHRRERPGVIQPLPDDGAGRRREGPMFYRELTMIDVRELLRR